MQNQSGKVPKHLCDTSGLLHELKAGLKKASDTERICAYYQKFETFKDLKLLLLMFPDEQQN